MREDVLVAAPEREAHALRVERVDQRVGEGAVDADGAVLVAIARQRGAAVGLKPR